MATTPIQRRFIGFSTQNTAKTGISTIYDIDLVNADLMAAFMTKVGERVMRPDWGCKLWDYLMEPFTDTMRGQIVAEVERICGLDTRLQTTNVQVFELDNGFRIEATLLYVPWKVVDTFTATFVQNDAVYFGTNTASNLMITG